MFERTPEGQRGAFEVFRQDPVVLQQVVAQRDAEVAEETRLREEANAALAERQAEEQRQFDEAFANRRREANREFQLLREGNRIRAAENEAEARRAADALGAFLREQDFLLDRELRESLDDLAPPARFTDRFQGVGNQLASLLASNIATAESPRDIARGFLPGAAGIGVGALVGGPFGIIAAAGTQRLLQEIVDNTGGIFDNTQGLREPVAAEAAIFGVARDIRSTFDQPAITGGGGLAGALAGVNLTPDQRELLRQNIGGNIFELTINIDGVTYSSGDPLTDAEIRRIALAALGVIEEEAADNRAFTGDPFGRGTGT